MVDIGAMPAGKELDILIAEKVMGLTRGVDFGEWPEHDWKRDADGTIDEMAWDTDYAWGRTCQRCWDMPTPRESYGTCHVDPPAYSTDLKDAWKVAERMGISVGPLYCYRKPQNGSIVGEWIASASGMNSMTAATATLAICRAALAAVQE